MKKIIIYIPIEYKEKVKNAMFHAGAGTIGQYKNCCFETLGVGQFLPSSKATPFIGKNLELSKIKEYKVEMICNDSCLVAAIEEMKKAHPYEEPAFDIIETVNYEQLKINLKIS